MSTTSLVVIDFGANTLCLRRHWGGDPEIVGRQVLDQLASAKSMKPRSHMHTESWLIRLLMAETDGGEEELPLYEVDCYDENVLGDWEFAYIFRALPVPVPENGFYNDVGNQWTIGYVEGADGEGLEVLEKSARWFSEEDFSTFVDDEFEKGMAAGKVYDVQLRGAFVRKYNSGNKNK